jgi:hypothetical protein
MESARMFDNVKCVYENKNITVRPYMQLFSDIVSAKKIEFTYPDSGSCLAGKTYTVVTVLTEDIN